MDIVLTGASGFIGRSLVQRWARRHRLYAIGRTAVPGTTHIQADLECGLDASALPERFDVAVHLASDRSSSQATFRVDAASTFELIEAARDRGARRFVLASSGNVYGWRDGDSDEETALAPRDLYAHCKVIAEQIVHAYRDHLATTVLRLYMPYGAGQRRRLFPDLVERVRERRPVTLVNGGTPILNPIYIADVLDIFDRALDVPGHALLNVGGSEALSIRDMAEMISAALAVPVTFQSEDRADQPRQLVGRIDRLCSWLGHPPRVGFAEGLARSLSPDALPVRTAAP